MTILLATRRESFVTLATDRLWHLYQGADAPLLATERKIVIHPTFPLAVGSGGFGRLPYGGTLTLVPVLLEDVMATITRPNDLTLAGVMKRLEDRLRPLVREALADPTLPNYPHKSRVVVHVALATRRRVDLGRLEIAQRAGWEWADGCIDAPPTLAPFFTGAYPDGEALYGFRFTDPSRVADHLRSVVASGIEAERALHSGKNLEVGGGVDVAVIDASGARFD